MKLDEAVNEAGKERKRGNLEAAWDGQLLDEGSQRMAGAI